MNGLMMRFGGLLAVNNVNLELYPQEIVSLIGPNGAGKTTVFNCLTGRPGPSQRIPQTGRVGVIAVSHLVALLCPATGVDPARRCGCTVITQMRKATQQLI